MPQQQKEKKRKVAHKTTTCSTGTEKVTEQMIMLISVQLYVENLTGDLFI